MSTAKLRQLFADDWTYDEIAAENERQTGWRPSRAWVMRKREAMGFPARRLAHANLLPWTVLPEHNESRFRYMLQAESRKRQGVALSGRDQREVALLHDLLYGRTAGADGTGMALVVGYDPRIGFHLLDRKETDTDIIREPGTR